MNKAYLQAVAEEKAAPDRAEEKDLSANAEEKEQLQAKLNHVFAPETPQEIEKQQPSADAPKLEGPTINQ